MPSFLEPSEEAFHLVTNFFLILTLNFRCHQHFRFALGTFELFTVLIHFPSNVTLLREKLAIRPLFAVGIHTCVHKVYTHACTNLNLPKSKSKPLSLIFKETS